MQNFIDIVKWDGTPDIFAYKFPDNQLNTKTQLIVSQSQEAVFVKEGQFYGTFGPGRYVLDTKNYPFLTRLTTAFLSGGFSPFTAEVWFVQKAIPLDLKWGTSIPLQIEDPLYHIMLPVRAFGQYGLRVENSKKFLAKMVGRVPYFSTDILSSYFRGIIVTNVKACLSSYLLDKKFSILHIGNQMQEISKYLDERISKEILEFGLHTVSFSVNAITTDENDPAVIQLKAALAKKAEMNIIGYTYQQERSFDTMEAAASNAGVGGNLLGAGIGLGLGTTAGVHMGAMVNNILQSLNTKPMRQCPKCSSNIPDNAKFCQECGTSLLTVSEKNTQKCPHCGASCTHVKFCPECGAKQE